MSFANVRLLKSGWTTSKSTYRSKPQPPEEVKPKPETQSSNRKTAKTFSSNEKKSPPNSGSKKRPFLPAGPSSPTRRSPFQVEDNRTEWDRKGYMMNKFDRSTLITSNNNRYGSGNQAYGSPEAQSRYMERNTTYRDERNTVNIDRFGKCTYCEKRSPQSKEQVRSSTNYNEMGGQELFGRELYFKGRIYSYNDHA